MQLIVGLGNIQRKHARNRHNIGFMVVDKVAQLHGLGNYKKQFSGCTAYGDIDGNRVGILKPATFMNDSGRSVGQALRFFKLTPKQILVVHDDIDLEPGKIRVKTGGGTGGHNGLKSIDGHIGKDYRRIRIGIGHPGSKELVSTFVLNDFLEDDQFWLRETVTAIAEALPVVLIADDSGFVNKVSNLRKLENGKS